MQVDRSAAGVARRCVVLGANRSALDLDLLLLWSRRELLLFLIWRDLKVRYKQAVLGVGWAVVQPVLAVTIFTVIFGHFARLPSDGTPYPLFAFTAVLPWTYFAEAVRRSSAGLVDDAELIRKVYFPRLLLPLAMVAAPLVDFLVAFVVLLAVLAWYGLAPTANIVFLPLFVALMVCTALAVGLWLGPLGVRFRDVKHTLPFVLQVWMYASPIVYPLSLVPAKWKLVYSLNPMVGVIEGMRWAVLGTRSPDLLAIGVSACLVLVLLIGGLAYFKKHERFFADLI